MQVRDAADANNSTPRQMRMELRSALGDSIIDSADDAIISKDLRGFILSWNPGAERLFGYTADEAIGQPISLLVPPELKHEETELFERLRRGERVSHYETLRLAKGGRTVPVALTVSPIKDGRDRVIGTSLIARDITERREAERLRAHLVAVVESADDGIISMDPAGVVLSWNKGAERLFGYRADEMVGRSISVLIPDNRPHEEAEMTDKIRRGERVVHHETSRVAKDGRQIPVSITISPIRGPNGKIVGASKIVRDLSEQRRSQALRASEARERARASELQAIIEAVPAAVLFSEASDCEQVYANRGGHELLEALRNSGDELLPEILASLKRVAGGELIGQWETRVLLADGEEHYFMGNAVPLREECGDVHGAVAALVDITERIRAEMALKEADRRKDEFLAMLAHELRNPIAPIRTAFDIIRRSPDDVRRRDWALEVVDRQLVQLTRIIDDLLELGRIVNGKIALKRETTTLRTLVSSAIESARPLINAQRHVLHVDLPNQDMPLHVDPVRISQALTNLLTNAAKFTPAGGTILVSARRQGDELELRVQDTGRGIDKSLLPRVFDMFVQGECDLARSEGGLGIGLSVVRRIVDLHGGRIKARSEGKDKGSEFAIHLPLPPEVVQQSPMQDETPPFATSVRSVLVVDDNRDVADSMAELLGMSGHNVERHYEGNGVLEKALNFGADVLVIDIGLPGCNGYDVARAVRSHPELKSVPIIAVSGYGQPSDVEKSRAAGINYHLLKPVDTDLLVKLIETTPPLLN